MNYYERHIGDYLKDTAHLSLLEHGVYTRLMDVYYTRECGIPDGEAARLIGARSREERAALTAVLAEFFVLIDGVQRQDRCDREIARFQDKQSKAKRSADARWNAQRSQSEGNANASADAMRTHSEGNAPRARPQSPDTSNQEPLDGGQSEGKGRPEPPEPLPALSETRSTFDQRMPDDWQPTEDTRQQIARARPDLVPVLDTVAEKFRLYAQSTVGYGGLSRDWQASFRRWVANERPHKPGSTGSKQADLEARNKAVADAWQPPEIRDATA